MSDFNVTKLENGDFEVTKNHQFKAKVLLVLWVVAIIILAIISA